MSKGIKTKMLLEMLPGSKKVVADYVVRRTRLGSLFTVAKRTDRDEIDPPPVFTGKGMTADDVVAFLLKPEFETTGDEQADTDAFEDYVGGVQRAQHMLMVWGDSYAYTDNFTQRNTKTRAEVFRSKAKQRGFNDKEVDAFLKLQ